MSYDIDKASDVEQIQRESAIHNARQVKTVIVGTGNCLQCDKVVAGDRRWCDNFCRDDWARWNPQA